MSVKDTYPLSSPSLLFDFSRTKKLDPRISFSRNSVATAFDAGGNLVTMSANFPRFDYDAQAFSSKGILVEEVRTNSIRNNTMVGAVAGTPGTLPTNWFSQSVGGVALTEVVGTGTEDGIAYVDVRYAGTTSSTSVGGILTEQTTQIAALSEQTWASSFFLKIVGGSTANISDIFNSIHERDAGGTLLVATNTTITPTGAALNTQRFSTTRTLNNASTAFVGQRITIAPVSGAAIDITLRIGMPQLEQGAFATSVITTSNGAITREADTLTVNEPFSWYNPNFNTLVIEFESMSPLDAGQSQALFRYPHLYTFDMGTPDSVIFLYGIRADVYINGTYNNLGTIPSGINKLVVSQSFTGGQSQSSLNGGTAINRNGTLSGTTPSKIRLGSDGNSTPGAGTYMNGWIRNFYVYPNTINSSMLQILSR